MASLIQSAKISATGVTSFPLNIGNSAGNGTVDTTPGSLLIGYVASPTAGRTCSGSDNVNGAYNADAGGASSCNITSFLNNAGGALTFTGSISGGATSIAIIFEEWSATVTNPALDAHAAAGFTAQTSVTTTATGTLAQANELVVAMCRTATNPGAGYIATGAFTPDPIGTSSPGGTACLIAAYQIVSSTTSVACTFGSPWTNSVNGGTSIASYKLITSPPSPPLLSRKYFLYYT